MEKVKMDIHPFEAELIQSIREIKHGNITIQIADGLPIFGTEPVKNIDFRKKVSQKQKSTQ